MSLQRLPLTEAQTRPFYRRAVHAAPTHAQLILRNERRVLEDVRRQLMAEPPSRERTMLQEACRRELQEVRDALAILAEAA